MRKRPVISLFARTIFVLCDLCLLPLTAGWADGLDDAPFIQEYHQAHTIEGRSGCNDVRAMAVDSYDGVWAATAAGIYRLDPNMDYWTQLMPEVDIGPTYDIGVDNRGTVWIGAWNGMYHGGPDGLQRLNGVQGPIAAVCIDGGTVIGLGSGGIWRIVHDRSTFTNVPYSRQFRAVLPAGDGGLWIGTGMGLYRHSREGYRLYQSLVELVSPDVYDVAYGPDNTLWIGGLGGVTVYRGDNRITSFTPEDGLPSVSVRSVAQGSDGVMWVGTDRGVARYDGSNWSLRHSRPWLVGDDVRDVAFDSHGTAWIATGAGVSAIRREQMTLAQKADHFLSICLARHVREPGLVEKCALNVPGDVETWKPRDDDNDGQYTGMYLAMESFRYAATKAPDAKANAKKAFEALRFLQTVTDTPGFVARTVIPRSWTKMADPNRTISDRQWAEMYVDNPREKRVEVHWRPSRDGRWFWKGDTSSDEITGHMFGYLFYYDLVADPSERRRVCQHVQKIVDCIIDGGYVLRGMDGTHTKWGVWAPAKLNDDPDWAPERGINSVEILSFLKLAYHMSGQQRYQKEYLRLLHEHNYAANVKHAKTTHPAWRTHIDDELLALAYPCLLIYEDDPDLKRLYRASLDQWYAAVEPDRSPFFDFIYGVCAGSPVHLDDSVASLRDASLDLIRWTIDNSKREDIKIVRSPELEVLQTNRLLPISERGVIRWDENPRRVVQGDGGRTESDGVWWLLPYWMGRYYRYIHAPSL